MQSDGASRAMPIRVDGKTLLLGIDLIETAVHKEARGGARPQRGFSRNRVREVLTDRLDCPMSIFESYWLAHVGMPDVFAFLRTNAEAIASTGPFDAANFLEVQMGFADHRMDEDDQPRAVFRRLFTLLAAGELTEKDFR